ncbi:hypothetical protein BD413DRAFT_1875 [Trametes elegans]|nr:hypothetical protein BD413DRAFT_1875 [Trametes elegans]
MRHRHSDSGAGEAATQQLPLVYGEGRHAGRARPQFTQYDTGKEVRRPPWHCCICMRERYVKPVALVCGHSFCRSCIVRELAQDAACPVCKSDILVLFD